MLARPPLPRRQPEAFSKRMRERALIAETDRQRDIRQRYARIGEQRERRIEPQPLQITMRRFAERFEKNWWKRRMPKPQCAARSAIRSGSDRCARNHRSMRAKSSPRACVQPYVRHQRTAQVRRGLPRKTPRHQ